MFIHRLKQELVVLPFCRLTDIICAQNDFKFGNSSEIGTSEFRSIFPLTVSNNLPQKKKFI